MTEQFNFDFTLEKLSKCLTHNKHPELWFEALSKCLPKYNINTVETTAGFLAQCQHESCDFTVLQENLNYGSKGLRKVFRKYFPTDALAEQYQRKPELIANRVYASRMGNGDEKSGEGWLYRGRGILQVTGKNNYIHCSKELFNDDRLVSDPELLLLPENAILSACWYWNSRNINETCVKHDIQAMTLRVNGGDNGLAERTSNWKRALTILKG